MLNGRRGFTLIELVMVIVLLGILAIVAIPKYYDLQNDALLASEKGVLGAVRSGIVTYYSKYKAYPATLDGYAAAACSATVKCFDTVLDQGGIQQDWTKVSGNSYSGPSAPTTTYVYNNVDGSFV